MIIRRRNRSLNVVFQGDSLTQGSLYSNNVMSQFYGNVSWQNVALAGKTIDYITSVAGDTDALRTHTKRNNVLVVWIGTNDYLVSPAVWLPKLWAYCDARRLAGWRVALGTVLPRKGGGNTNTFTASLRTDYNGHIDGLFDMVANVNLQDPNNTTYFNADGIHLITAGYDIVTAVCYPVVKSLSY